MTPIEINYLTYIWELIKVAYLLGQSGPSFVHRGSVSLVHRVDIGLCAVHQYWSCVEKSGIGGQPQWHWSQSGKAWRKDASSLKVKGKGKDKGAPL